MLSKIAELFADRGVLIPPRALRVRVGPFESRRDFIAAGEFFVEMLKKLNCFNCSNHILDIGCGPGQVAIPLAKFLSPHGFYTGFDVDQKAIQFCVSRISSAYPHFHFKHIDLFNGLYNPKGKIKPSEFRFPYLSESFDLVIAKSLFTHMLEEDIENFIAEISRVLKQGGNCLLTFFLFNQEGNGNFLVLDPNEPEKSICYDETFVQKMLSKNGLAIQGQIHYGCWRKQYSKMPDYQDIVIVKK